MGVAPTIDTTVWSVYDAAQADFILEWAAALSNDTSPPLVHSISYGASVACCRCGVARTHEAVPCCGCVCV